MIQQKIINQNINVPIIKEERLNEWNYGKGESKENFLQRNIDAINEIVNFSDSEDIIICVSSGVNLTAFILSYLKITPSNDTPIAQAVLCSPVIFNYEK